MTDVWILETGCYEQRGVSGVYETAEAAMAAHDRNIRAGANIATSRPGGWRFDGGRWDNGLDWDWAATVTKWTVEAHYPEEDT